MGITRLDTLGLKCPQPILKIAAKITELENGDILEVISDCPNFPADVKKFCERLQKPLLYIGKNGDGKMKCQIQC
jgi:tRNA 2-thiouridine synthesizing protein A